MAVATLASLTQATILYPFEFFKTQYQLQRAVLNPPYYLEHVNHSIKTYFKGCSALNVAMACKVGTRFYVFDKVTEIMKQKSGTPLLGTKLINAAIITGLMESLCIIPFENIKILMIENALLESHRVNNPKEKIQLTEIKGQEKNKKTFHKALYKLSPKEKAFLHYEKYPSTGFLSAIKELYTSKGVRGLLQGSGLTMFRQVGNSVSMFTTYTALKQIVSRYNSKPLDSYTYIGIDLATSCTVVAVTQPIDVIKTRMQGKYAWKYYKNALNCAYRLSVEEGIPKFWKGWVPRLMKVSLSSTVSLSIYRYASNVMNTLTQDKILK